MERTDIYIYDHALLRLAINYIIYIYDHALLRLAINYIIKQVHGGDSTLTKA